MVRDGLDHAEGLAVIDLVAAKRKCLPMAGVLRFGGDSDSESPTTNTTKSNSNQVGASENGVAIGLTGDGNNINYSSVTTDQGAVKGALNLALKGVEGAYGLAGDARETQALAFKFARESQQAAGSIMDGALHNSAAQQEKFTQAFENVKTSDVRVLIITGLAVVGIAAVMLATKKG